MIYKGTLVSQGFVNSDVSWKGVGFAIAFGR